MVTEQSNMNTKSSPFAVFLLAGSPDATCITTRPNGGIGLPGGKVDPGETATEAVRREAHEEGWTLPDGADLTLVYEAEVEGRPVAWFATSATPIQSAGDHKEAHRGIMPVILPASTLAGFGNPGAVEAWKKWGAA